MYMHPDKLVRDAETLSDNLGPTFILLVGSAVSGASPPKLPMVPEVLSGFFERAAVVLQTGPYGDCLLAEYARSLCRGRYSTILNTTKFEEFLWHIETAAGRYSLDDLLARLYVCDRDEYGPNQSAISWLLEKRRCTACLTTNFDNTLELSYPSLKTYCHPNYPRALPGPNQPPVLLKLHGDAQEQNCVATSPGLSHARRLAEYKNLRDLIAGQTVLVVGYSGFGDVDISPHLALVGARFIWGVPDRKSRVPDFAQFRVLSDLSASDPKKNLLLGLAVIHGWEDKSLGKEHKWQEGFDEWCNSLDKRILRRIVISTLLGQAGWPVLHIFHCASEISEVDLSPLDHGIVCLQVAAYDSAGECFKKALSSDKLSLSDRIKIYTHLGFTQWRQGRLEDALRTLWQLYDLDFESLPLEDRLEIVNGLRIYLEVSRDWMQYRRRVIERQNFYKEKALGQVIQRLESLPPGDAGSSILTRTVILDIRRLIGEHVTAAKIQDIYNESFSLMYWSIAEAVARLLVNVSFWQGLVALFKVDRQLVRRRNWNTIRKSIAAILHSLVRGHFPIILSLLDGPLLMTWKTALVEWRYRRKLRMWEMNREEGKVHMA